MMTLDRKAISALLAIALFPVFILADDTGFNVSTAKADPWAGAFGGAIIGGLITGRTGGAVAGAVIGGLAGGAYEAEKRRNWRARRGRHTRQYRQSTQRRYRRPAPRRSGLVIEVQKELVVLGHDPGPVDGLVGARTSAAVREYQARHNLLTDGRISPQLLDHMRMQKGG